MTRDYTIFERLRRTSRDARGWIMSCVLTLEFQLDSGYPLSLMDVEVIHCEGTPGATTIPPLVKRRRKMDIRLNLFL